MKINGKHYRTIWEGNESGIIEIIDQRRLPHNFETVQLRTVEDTYTAIKEMYVRGAPLIGAAAAYGIYLAAGNIKNNNDFISKLHKAADYLKSSRPTAINLSMAIDRQLAAIIGLNDKEEIINTLLRTARKICEEDVGFCKSIGKYGKKIIENIYNKKNSTVNILTHCNAGWLATVDYGTAAAPIYFAHDSGIDVHVWVDETRPRNQGAKLTAWELSNHGIKNTLIVDNAGGHLMQNGMIDLVIVGSDRTSAGGDVANKIGTYLKALAAKDNDIPFYVALPSTTIDWSIEDGLKEIPIEQRNPDEVLFVDGLHEGTVKNVLVPQYNTLAANYAFDVTPRNFVTGLITEKGICKADRNELRNLFPEKFK